MDEVISSRLKSRRSELGWSQAELAARVSQDRGRKISQQAIAAIESGNVIDSVAFPSIAKVMGVRLDWLMHGIEPKEYQTVDGAYQSGADFTIPLRGVIAAGVWREVESGGSMKRVDKPFPPDPRYSLKAQYDLIIEGTSINRFAPEGHRLRCIDLLESGIEFRDGDLVIVRRTRSTMGAETTAKRVRFRGHGVTELWPESDDPLWQEPLTIRQSDPDTTQDEIRIIAKVLYAYNPA